MNFFIKKTSTIYQLPAFNGREALLETFQGSTNQLSIKLEYFFIYKSSKNREKNHRVPYRALKLICYRQKQSFIFIIYPMRIHRIYKAQAFTEYVVLL